MLKGFKEFILKGNVVELATAVIIGGAFTAIVTAFTDSIIEPLLNSIPGGSNPTKGLGFQITDNPSTFVNLGALITAIINFVIIAAVVYFLIVVPYNKLAALGGYGKKAEVTEVALLAEIRDLLDPEGTSRAQDAAEAELPDHIQDHGAPPGNDAGATQRLTTPPPAEPIPPTQPAPTPPPPGENPPYPTPQPAPGNYPPPGAYPPGNYPQQGGYPGQTQFPGEYPPPDAPGRHSR